LEQRYFIKLSYNGANYHGWQIQENAISVQEVIEKGLSLITGERIAISGAGRTDTGVHAREMFAHFDFRSLEPEAIEKLTIKLNSYLPSDIAIYSIFPVNNDAHARFSAISRTYKYFIRQMKDPFYGDLSYYLFGKLDVDLMNKGAKLMIEFDDFTSFSKVHTQVKTNFCKIEEAHWAWNGDLLVFTITADRFLRNMVRAIVGTLIDLGKHKLDLNELKTIVESKDRSRAGFSVPANALFLTGIVYPRDIYS